MKVAKLDIHGFRGIRTTCVTFPGHTVLVGPNGAGKSSVVDALCLVLGRERMVRALTEHDFVDADPKEADRFRIVATLTFPDSDLSKYEHWFHDGAGIPKWWRGIDSAVLPDSEPNAQLCVQIGYVARFDRDTLEVESRRYFHDDDDQTDPFLDEGTIGLPSRLLAEIGLFVAPALRTRERVLSFASDTFRRLIAGTDGIPATELLQERDRLRTPASPIEATGELKGIVDRLNEQLGSLVGKPVKFQLRVNGTSSEALLQSLVSHYEVDAGLSLPVGAHGTGLLSLQTILLLFELCRLRRTAGKSVILVVEEPELHLPPGLQSRIVKSAIAAADQALFTTHSPRVAAIPAPQSVVLLSREPGCRVRAERLATGPLTQATPNAIRKLYADHRQQLAEALMYQFVLVPEGRIDYQWLRLLTDAVELGEETNTTFQFGALVGVVPTHDGAVAKTFQELARTRGGVATIVDGDTEGTSKAKELLQLAAPPCAVLQWASGWTIEDVVHTVVSTDWVTISSLITPDLGSFPTADALRDRLREKSPTGLKDNYLAHEVIASAIRSSPAARGRAAAILDAIVEHLTSPSATPELTTVKV